MTPDLVNLLQSTGQVIEPNLLKLRDEFVAGSVDITAEKVEKRGGVRADRRDGDDDGYDEGDDDGGDDDDDDGDDDDGDDDEEEKGNHHIVIT